MVEVEYAKAIFEIAQENKKEDLYRSYFRTLSYSLDDEEFFKLLKSPFISNKEKKEMIKNVYKDFDEDFINFLNVVIDHDRFYLIRAIRSEYKKLLYSNSGLLKINVISAYELSEAELNRIKKALIERFNDKSLKIHNEVDPSIIGGIQILANDESIDISLKSSLNKLKESL